MQKNTAHWLQEVSTLQIIEICIGEFEQGTDKNDQAGSSCGESSQADLIQNFILKMRM